MPYIKLLTVLTTLALLTACGGAATPKTDNSGGDDPCKTNAFQATCSADDPAIIALRESQCLADTTIDSTCVGEDGIATVFCKDAPFDTSNACKADTGAIALRQSMCLANAGTNPACTGAQGIATVFCKADPFNTATACMADTFLPDRIADCIEDDNVNEMRCENLFTATASNDCLTNPFAVACKTDEEFDDYVDDARANRLGFCETMGNEDDTLCISTTKVHLCVFSPFSKLCTTDNLFLPNRRSACLLDIMADDSCRGEMGIATVFCKDDPFHDSNACTADTFLPERIAECIKTENTEGNMMCDTLTSDNAKNTAITACLTNPFSSACAMNDDFTAHAEMAQANRASFCNDSMKSANTLCMGENLTGVCGVDPFNALCIMNTAYLPNRQLRCVTDAMPHTSCGTVLGSFVDPTDITGITTPTGVLNHADLPATVAEAIANTDIRSHFLSVGANGVIDRAGLVNPAAATLSRTGDAMDGVTYVAGAIGVDAESFVGLLPTTNLGAPLSSPPADTTWEGRYYSGLTNAIHPITFNVNFGTKKITTELDSQSIYKTEFDLEFTATGVITGSVVITNIINQPADTAQARGLIGEEGLVGGFANTDSNGGWGGSLYGGFVADNPDYTAPE